MAFLEQNKVVKAPVQGSYMDTKCDSMTPFDKFLMDEQGQLIINAKQLDENGEVVEGLGILILREEIPTT